MKLLVGCDPEAFLVHRKTGKAVSAHGLIPGTKDDPHIVEGGMIQVDGMAVEFGIEPAPDVRTFRRSINVVLRQLRDAVPKELDIVFQPIIEFDDDVLSTQPAEALALGCDPDFNAYTLNRNPAPQPPKPSIRSAGGHVHLGWNTGMSAFSREHILACSALVAELDYSLGVPSLSWDHDNLRRTIYGKAGAFRPKSYGLEYRTLSNAWLQSPELIDYVFLQTEKAFNRVVNQVAYTADKISLFQNRVRLTAKDVIDNNLTAIGESFVRNVQ
jgi:hypothetical protein